MDDLDRCNRCACLPCRCDIEYPEIVIEDCSSCAARCRGVVADYCSHKHIPERDFPNGRQIAGYPTKPEWCPGYIPEDDDFEWC